MLLFDLVNVLVLLLVAAGVGIVIGVVVAGARHRKALSEAVTAAEERARTQILLAQTQPVTQDDRHRLRDLIVNLPETVNMMGAARSTTALCRITVRAVMDLVDARRVGLFLARGTPPRFGLEVFAGHPRPPDQLGFEIGEGRLGRLAELIGVRSGDDLTVTAPASTTADDTFGPDLCVAVRRRGTVHAFIVVDDPKIADAMTRRVLQMIADLHGVSAEGLKLLHKERARAELDKLTGLFNRHHLDRRMAEEVERAQAYDLKLSVFLFDIDHFKHYNDTNGHQAGDDCLKWVAAVSRKVTRGSDVICRYGGEEFLIIHLGSGRDDAWHHAERVRRAIAGTLFPGGPSQPLGRVSISGGVASFPEDATDAVQLVALADRALYAAKESGRDRVLRAAEIAEGSPAFQEPASPPPGQRGGAPQPARAPVDPRAHAKLRATDPVITPLPVPVPVAEPPAAVPRLENREDVRRSDPAIMPLAARYASSRTGPPPDRQDAAAAPSSPNPEGTYSIHGAAKRRDRLR